MAIDILDKKQKTIFNPLKIKFCWAATQLYATMEHAPLLSTPCFSLGNRYRWIPPQKLSPSDKNRKVFFIHPMTWTDLLYEKKQEIL